MSNLRNYFKGGDIRTIAIIFILGPITVTGPHYTSVYYI